MQLSELKEMKSASGNKQKYEKVSQNDDKSEIVIFQSNRKNSVSFSLQSNEKISFADTEVEMHVKILIRSPISNPRRQCSP